MAAVVVAVHVVVVVVEVVAVVAFADKRQAPRLSMLADSVSVCECACV